jgi:branched-chain amino acid transport system substrate-binding protein
MEFEVYNGGKGYMRKDDHQFFQPMYIASFGELTKDEPFDGISARSREHLSRHC